MANAGETGRRLVSLLKKYRPDANAKQFAGVYAQAIADARTAGSITSADAERLQELAATLEAWWSSSRPPAQEIWQQWLELRRRPRSGVLGTAIGAVLDKLPKVTVNSSLWVAEIFKAPDAALIRHLLKRRVLKLADLRKLAASRPADFYMSAGLDIMIDRGLLASTSRSSRTEGKAI